jgi:rhodanese-related sulfurtransferase
LSLDTLSPAEARRLIDDGAILVDIRDADEHAREHIPGARNLPLSAIRAGQAELGNHRALIYHCHSGARTTANAAALKAASPCDAFIVEGGLEAWRRAGLPVNVDRRQPLPLMRQVQIGAGSIVVLGLALGTMVSPWFLLLSAFMGSGLVFAGVSGWCGMALLLRRLPWNRRTVAA